MLQIIVRKQSSDKYVLLTLDNEAYDILKSCKIPMECWNYDPKLKNCTIPNTNFKKFPHIKRHYISMKHLIAIGKDYHKCYIQVFHKNNNVYDFSKTNLHFGSVTRPYKPRDPGYRNNHYATYFDGMVFTRNDMFTTEGNVISHNKTQTVQQLVPNTVT